MRKLVPFQKEIPFQTPIFEITGISLEHTLHLEKDHVVTGEFIITGEYRISESSHNTENFNYQIPFDIHIDDHYSVDQVQIDINDFYYEIVNNDTLVVNIEVRMDGLKEVEELEEHVRKTEQLDEETKEPVIPIPVETEETVVPVFEEKTSVEIEKPVSKTVEVEEKVNSLFGNLKEDTETYATYHVYIVREGDTIENILTNYHVTREDVEPYNNLQEVKVGDKFIIPATNVKDE